ncbi:SGNH/GDSL hydrolase family protein [Marilutibacter alkalisoli]|uniref:SGNH/GDSL hydrolase family protein n=1 Tax=Marilutibacter alkalisoli TaxID=2591633 RepID=A0A514BN84_9GAMM|nr:SGNH/GDSL hydrolase family protein [Lysobacter alkalisoli]QDH68830.1 SGNH/GDSL hydrolase family protein [Lysobacter alkalisoli]
MAVLQPPQIRWHAEKLHGDDLPCQVREHSMMSGFRVRDWMLALVLCAGVGWPRQAAAQPLPLAVIGDSDSHAYQDRISFPEGGPERGGAWRTSTFNWVEVLARLRGDELDPGEWGAYGVPGRLARVLDGVGVQARRPRKQDYRFNFAVSGAGCGDLMGGVRQVPALIELMDEAPERWRRGVVVIRIGINDVGTRTALLELAADPAGSPAAGRIADCVDAIRVAVQAIHRRHPDTRIVLVGIFDNTHWAQDLAKDWTPAGLANIARALDGYDRALIDMARGDDRLTFFDDRRWFAGRWGGRDARGQPAYRDVVLPGRIRVSNSVGDAPRHAVLQDGHAGVAWSAAWAQSLVILLNLRWESGLTPISDEEVAGLVKADAPKRRQAGAAP